MENMLTLNWEDSSNIVLGEESSNTNKFVEFINKNFKSHILIKTSGSTNKAKWVALSKEAILSSATAVNKHLNVTSKDKWLIPIPIFHIGGLSILARAFLSESKYNFFDQKWDPVAFKNAIENSDSTLTSLVPTQIFDIVESHLTSPKSLRVVLVGGGKLSEELYFKARKLGWPLLPTYGMTECASQIATAEIESLDKDIYPNLKVLSHIHLNFNLEGYICIKSPSLFTALVSFQHEDFLLAPRIKEEFITEDRGKWADSTGSCIFISGRSGDRVKIKGHLVDKEEINLKFKDQFGQNFYEIISVPKDREENILVLITSHFNIDQVETHVSTFNNGLPNYEKIKQVYFIKNIPRTAIGKLKREELNKLLFSGDSRLLFRSND
jgi:O-succinylbenzoic acid--CoA ligase